MVCQPAKLDWASVMGPVQEQPQGHAVGPPGAAAHKFQGQITAMSHWGS